MKILMTGSDGQLGRELSVSLEYKRTALGVPAILKEETETILTDASTLDITDEDSVMRFAKESRPDVIINCAAFTNVNACESERDAAINVNAYGVRNLAMAANEVNATLVHISTDYVFSGEGDTPYTENDITNPINEYGRSKLEGERFALMAKKVFVIRTSWLYGIYGNNFVKTILSKAKDQKELHVVSDQYGTPTNAEDLAHHVLTLIGTKSYGIYHASGMGVTSWYEFAKTALDFYGSDALLLPCKTEDYPTPARRPKYSALENKKLNDLGLNEFRDWKDALCAFINKLER